MKVFLLKDVENVGFAKEIVKVSDGFALNFLIPKKLAVKALAEHEQLFEKNKRTIQNRQEVLASKTSMLAEKIKGLSLVLKRKMHDDGKLYGAVSASEIVDLLALHSVSVGKSQIEFEKNIKEKGTYTFTIKLTTQLKPKVTVKVVPETAVVAN